MKSKTYNGCNNVLTLMKMRLLHLKLVSSCDTFNNIFSMYNLAISFSVFVECITIFTELYMLYIESITTFDIFGVTTTLVSFVSEIIHHIAVITFSTMLRAQVTKIL